eukprot:SAG11_NODE_1572_length_4664_cov_8.611172_6_plen_137_part_00
MPNFSRYKVRWRSYDEADDTWETTQSLIASGDEAVQLLMLKRMELHYKAMLQAQIASERPTQPRRGCATSRGMWRAPSHSTICLRSLGRGQPKKTSQHGHRARVANSGLFKVHDVDFAVFGGSGTHCLPSVLTACL